MIKQMRRSCWRRNISVPWLVGALIILADFPVLAAEKAVVVYDALFDQGSAVVAVIPSSNSVLMPGGTEVSISTNTTLSSASAVVGEKFSFHANKDVLINGSIVVFKSAHGEGTIKSVDGSGGNGHAGKLGLQFDYIMSADGLKIQLTDSNNSQGGEEKKGASSTAAIVGYAVLGPLGLFAHNFVRGRQMEITPSMLLTVYTDHSVHITAPENLTTEEGYAK